MKKHQITPKRRRKFVKITDSSHDYPIAPNLLGRDFDSKEPDEVWVSDITYSAPRPLVGAHMCGMHHTIKEVKQKEIAVLYAAVECEPKRR